MHGNDVANSQLLHKEEFAACIEADVKDQKAVQDKLTSSIDPLDPEQHPNGLINTVSGKIIMSPSINVDMAAAIGKEQVANFEPKLPDGFYDVIPKSVNTIAFCTHFDASN